MATIPKNVKITVDKTREIAKALRALASQKVYVGIPAEKALRLDDPKKGDKASPVNNAFIGYIQENGAPIINLPPRPFLVPGVREGRESFLPYLQQAIEAGLEGNAARVNRALNAAGLKAQAAVRAKITSGPFQELSERTLAARRARGVTRTKPLIDTGQLRQSINYVVRQV